MYVIGALLAVACADDGRGVPPEETTAAPATQPASPGNVALEGPDTTAEALWAYLREQDYRADWRLWPGKGRLYEGREPHGMLLTTYVNDAAFEALSAGGVAELSGGAIIVKENWMPDTTFAAATVMYKVDDYDPANADWLFAKYGPLGDAEAFGRAAMCQDCHRNAEHYVFTPVGG